MNSNMSVPEGLTHRPGTLSAIMCLALSLLAMTAQAEYGGGNGTAEDPYLIYTAEQMNTIGLNREDWDKHFKLMADLDLSAYKGDSFNSIGISHPRYWPEIVPFTGVFDGNGHTLANFTYAVSKGEPDRTFEPWAIREVGMFRYVWDETTAPELWMHWLSRNAPARRESTAVPWHRNYATRNSWTRSGGVKPADWPEWMQAFKDY